MVSPGTRLGSFEVVSPLGAGAMGEVWRARDTRLGREVAHPGSKWTISNEGGSDPRWARDGRELFYRSGDKLMAVPLRLHPQFTAGSPRVLFESPQPWVGRHYDVTADGRRFVLVTDLQRNRVPLHFVVARDWYAALAH